MSVSVSLSRRRRSFGFHGIWAAEDADNAMEVNDSLTQEHTVMSISGCALSTPGDIRISAAYVPKTLGTTGIDEFYPGYE